MKPSTSPVVTTVGSYCTGTMVSSLASMPLALSRPAKICSLPPDCTPIFLPFIAAGSGMGFLSASETMQNAFFWNVAPMIFRGAPSLMAGAVMVGADRPTSALPEVTAASALVPAAPPAMRLTLEKPASLK